MAGILELLFCPMPAINFLTAAVEEGAKRRWKEMQEAGKLDTLENVMEDIKQRDLNDSNRSFAPLKKPKMQS